MFALKKKRNKLGTRGFSLMEVIISVGIISFSFVGIMAIFASNIRTEISNRDKITAAYLAQEGIEIVRQIRDNNWFAGGASSWNTGLTNGDHQAVSMVDPNDFSRGWTVGQASSLDSDKYKQRVFLLNGNYVQCSGTMCNDSSRTAAWTDTKFKRLVGIAYPTADVMQVTVTVYYGNASTQVVSYLYNNWYN